MSEDGDRLFENTESNGRFHSDWRSMTYSRLMLARNLLTEDGVVFISLDDGEIENLREICNEVFGEQNFLAQCVRKRRDSQANLSKIYPLYTSMSFCTPRVTEIFSIKLVLISMSVIIKSRQ